MLDIIWYAIVFLSPVLVALLIYRVLPVDPPAFEGSIPIFGNNTIKCTGAIATVLIMEALSLLVYQTITAKRETIKIVLFPEPALSERQLTSLKDGLVEDLKVRIQLNGENVVLDKFSVEGSNLVTTKSISVMKSFLNDDAQLIAWPEARFVLGTKSLKLSGAGGGIAYLPIGIFIRDEDSWTSRQDTIVEIHDPTSGTIKVARHHLFQNISAVDLQRLSMDQWIDPGLKQLEAVAYRVPQASIDALSTSLHVNSDAQRQLIERLATNVPDLPAGISLINLSATDGQASVASPRNGSKELSITWAPVVRLERLENPIKPKEAIYVMIKSVSNFSFPTNELLPVSAVYRYGATRMSYAIVSPKSTPICERLPPPVLQGGASAILTFEKRNDNILAISAQKLMRDSRISFKFGPKGPACPG